MKSKLIIRFTLVFLVLLSCTKQIDDSILDVDIEELLVEIDPILSTENTISSVGDVYLNGDVVESFDYEIMESDQFIRIVLPSGSNVSSVSIDFTMAENASLASSISGLNFTGTGIKLISVVAENGDTRTYALKIIVTGGVDPMPSPYEIISVTSVTASGIVVIPIEPAMFSDNSINVLLPAGTPLTDISFEFEITENSFLLDDATNLSFESGVTNEVRLESEEGEVRIYTITVELENTPDLSDENDIIKITATIGDAPNVTIIDEREAPEFDGSNSIILEVPFKTDISDVDLEFELSEFATLQIDDITTGLDFTGGVVKMFTVIAQDGSEQTYGIGVVIADPTQREALLEMYNAGGFSGGSEGNEWDLSEGSNITEWRGVTVNANGNVIGLENSNEEEPINFNSFIQYLPYLETIESSDSGDRLLPDEEFEGIVLENIKTISLGDLSGVTEQIPQFVIQQTNLKELNILGMGLATIQESISEMIGLEILNVRFNDLSNIPESIADLPNLTTLDIRNNDNLISIPQAICDWGEVDGHTLLKDDNTICGDLSSENQIIDVQLFTEAGVEIPQTANINIDNLSNEVTIAVPTNTDITALRVNLDISDGASVVFDPTDAFDFTTPETFIITAENGVDERIWSIEIILDAAITEGEAFITTWTGTEVLIPINTAFTYNYNVDWDNDGILDEFGITGEITHSFTTTGPHTIQITGEFPAINFSSVSDSVIGLEQWGTQEWLSVSSAFSGCENLIINATDVPDFTSVTSMGSMFRNAILVNPDVSLWNTTNVTIMTSMFFGASSANPDVSLWNTTNVTIMGSMFRDATLANPDVSLWDTTNVTNMFNMFSGAEIANPDVSLWDTTNVTNMESMFSNSGIMDPDFSNWDLENIFTMGSIFSGVTLSTEVYDQLLIDLSSKGQSRGIPFDGGNSTYCSAEAASARELLVNSGWTITDLGPMADCQTTFSPEIQAQRDALLAMYNGNSNWSEDTDMKDWTNITVDTVTGNVTGYSSTNASGHPITEFDSNLGKLIYLEELTSWNGNLTVIPDEIEYLTELSLLSMSFNNIKVIPDGILALAKLDRITLNGNIIEEVPAGIANLGNLTYLWLSSNNITSIPNEVCEMDLVWLDYDYSIVTCQ